MLTNTQPGTTKAGGPSKASYALADGVADRIKAASAELLELTRSTPASTSPDHVHEC